MKKILVPLDFSKVSLIGFEVACDIARRTNADITLLHVIEEVTTTSYEISASGTAEEENIEDKLVKQARSHFLKLMEESRHRELRLTPRLCVGNLLHAIQTIGREEKTDLIVMGTKGRTKLEEMLIGTHTDKVVRHSKCPVLSVSKMPVTMEFRNIVYASAMSPEEEAFSRFVKMAQETYHSTIHLVRINTRSNFESDQTAKSRMQEFARRLDLQNYTINVFNHSNPEEGILHFADSVNADMIAMATHGRTGIAHLIEKSVAEDVASHARRPVLTFAVKN